MSFIDRHWDPIESATYGWEGTGKDPATDDPVDEGDKESQGSRQFNLGWLRLNTLYIAPTTYTILGWIRWEEVCERPPIVATPLKGTEILDVLVERFHCSSTFPLIVACNRCHSVTELASWFDSTTPSHRWIDIT